LEYKNGSIVNRVPHIIIGLLSEQSKSVFSNLGERYSRSSSSKAVSERILDYVIRRQLCGCSCSSVQMQTAAHLAVALYP